MARTFVALRMQVPCRRYIAAVLSAASLAGCGGGGGDSAPAPSCVYQYPSLTGPAPLIGLDPNIADQWHLQNTGQNGGTPGEDIRAVAAWATHGVRGEGVRVAVVDDAVELVHADLFPNLVAGASYSYRNGNRGSVWPLPCATADDHGTAVAGIVLARDGNAVAGAGVAPRAALVAYDPLSTGFEADITDALNRDSASNAIYHNSWGSPDDGALHDPGAAFRAAIRSGIETGRQRLGSIYVFPAGNGGAYDNSNYDGYVNRLGVITVCAVDDAGRSPWYGERGANLLVCAPSSGDKPIAITTTAIQNGVRSDFSGTSASTPMVSGVVALMLSARPTLTWRDVRLILAQTARRNDTTDSGWTSHFGLNFNHKYGFGVVDANAAVATAKSWTSIGGWSTMKTCGPYDRSPQTAVPDASASGPGVPITDSVTVAGCNVAQIEFVEIRLTAAHPYSGDLRVRLTSPAGLVSQLADVRSCAAGACGAYADWPFGSARHMGEPANGAWSLEVTDMARFDVGTFNRWSITFYGR